MTWSELQSQQYIVVCLILPWLRMNRELQISQLRYLSRDGEGLNVSVSLRARVREGKCRARA